MNLVFFQRNHRTPSFALLLLQPQPRLWVVHFLVQLCELCWSQRWGTLECAGTSSQCLGSMLKYERPWDEMILGSVWVQNLRIYCNVMFRCTVAHGNFKIECPATGLRMLCRYIEDAEVTQLLDALQEAGQTSKYAKFLQSLWESSPIHQASKCQ